jgi:hypothetical protein
MEESDCIPINVVEWTNKCTRGDVSDDTIKSVLNADKPLMTDYLVKEIPNEGIEIPVRLLYTSNIVFERLLNIAPERREAIWHIFEVTQKACERELPSITSTAKNKLDKNSNEAIYGVLRFTGIMAFLWSVAVKRGVPDGLFSITMDDFNSTSLMVAQEMLVKWDDSIGKIDATYKDMVCMHKEFAYEDYYYMRKWFIDSLNSAARNVMRQYAKTNNIGRNDKCPCGSGLKFKQCHGNMDLDDIVKSPF